MIIIGITGTNGAGKGTVVDYLINNKGFSHYSARAFIVEEIKRRGLEANRTSMNEVGNDLRAKHTPSYVIEELYRQALAEGKNAVIESIRTPGEVAFLRTQANFYLLAVDADIKIRFERAVLRKSETDQVSFEVFKQEEEREMTAEDPNKQNISACVAQADAVLTNDTNMEDLYAQVDNFLTNIEVHV